MPLPRRPLVVAAVLAVPALAAAGFGLGAASAASSEDDRATTGRNVPIALADGDSTSSTPAGSASDSSTSEPSRPGIGGVDRSELQPLLDCMASLGLDIGDADQAKTVIEITWNDPGTPSIAINGTTIEPSAAINAALACRDELPPGMLDDLELPALDALGDLDLNLDELDELDPGQWPLGEGADLEAWQAKLDAFSACLDTAEEAGDVETWADAMQACALSLHD